MEQLFFCNFEEGIFYDANSKHFSQLIDRFTCRSASLKTCKKGTATGSYRIFDICILIGSFVFGSLGTQGIGITSTQIEGFGIISNLALGFIAFAIGNEFRVSQLKKIGKQAAIIGVFQALFTTVVVDAVLIGIHFIMPDKLSLPAAIVLASVAAATAPAATLMVVKQYKAKGPVTDVLLPVVALDDAVGLVVFAISFGVAKSIGIGNVDILSIVLEPILEVVLSLGLGFIMGLLFTICEKYFHSRSKRMAVSVAFVMMTVAISFLKFHIGIVHITFSSLLACMMLGSVFCNICKVSEELMQRVDRWTTPVLKTELFSKPFSK